jgi:CheY-like chemotaxis protein
MAEFDFIGPSDKPALVAITDAERQAAAKNALLELGYKVHTIDTHEEFPTRFAEVQYQVVLLDESFAGESIADNRTLYYVQHLAMNERRHAAILLVGPSFETLNALQAFQQSVHAVINYSEWSLLGQLLQKAVAENDLFLTTFRQTIVRVAQSRAETGKH